MIHRSARRLGCLVSLLVIALVGGAASAKSVDRSFKESFPVSRGMTLFLVHQSGDVTISPWDRDVLQVEVRYQGEFRRYGWGSDADFSAEFVATDEGIRVRGRESGEMKLGFMRSEISEHRYTIHAPSYMQLDLTGYEGNVTIDGWRARIVARLEDGLIRLRDIDNNRTSLRLEDGSVQAVGLRGDLIVIAEDAELSFSDCVSPVVRVQYEDGSLLFDRGGGSFRIEGHDGDTELRQVRAESIEIETEDGDVKLDLLQGSATDVEVSTVKGEIRLAIPPTVSAEFEIDAFDGEVILELPEGVDYNRDGPSRVSGVLGEARGKIDLETEGAAIRLSVRPAAD